MPRQWNAGVCSKHSLLAQSMKPTARMERITALPEDGTLRYGSTVNAIYFLGTHLPLFICSCFPLFLPLTVHELTPILFITLLCPL